jgi:hypothetical protein
LKKQRLSPNLANKEPIELESPASPREEIFIDLTHDSEAFECEESFPEEGDAEANENEPTQPTSNQASFILLGE